jgi:hypothetical protein
VIDPVINPAPPRPSGTIVVSLKCAGRGTLVQGDSTVTLKERAILAVLAVIAAAFVIVGITKGS